MEVILKHDDRHFGKLSKYVTKNVKNGAKTAVKNALKGLIVLPFAMLAWDYYKSRDVRATA